MRIKIKQYDEKKDAPVYPGKENYRKKEQRVIKVLAIVLAIIMLFGGVFLYAKMQFVHEKEGCLKAVKKVTSGTKYRSTIGLNLQIDNTYYYLDADYIYNDGVQYQIDHIQEMEWLLKSDKVMNRDICLQYLQLTEYDKPVILGAFCGDINILNMEYSLQIRHKQLCFDLLLGIVTIIVFWSVYLFRKKYSIVIMKD